MLLSLYRRKRYCVHWNCDGHCNWEWRKFKLKFSKMNALNVRLQTETDKKTHTNKMPQRTPKRIKRYKQVWVHGCFFFIFLICITARVWRCFFLLLFDWIDDVDKNAKQTEDDQSKFDQVEWTKAKQFNANKWKSKVWVNVIILRKIIFEPIFLINLFTDFPLIFIDRNITLRMNSD